MISMKRKIYLTVISLITAVCVMLGCAYHVFGWNAGSFAFIFEGASWGRSVTGNEELGSFENISAYLEVADIEFKTGDTFSISYECSDNMVPQYKIEGDTLVITQTGKQRFKFFGIDGHAEITLTVPYGTDIGKADFVLHVGDGSIEGMNIKDLHLENNVGDFEIAGSVLETADVNMNLGDFDMTNTSFDSMTVHSDLGDVEIESSKKLDAYTLRLETNMGEVTFNGRESHGSYNRESASGKLLKVESSMGDIEVSD